MLMAVQIDWDKRELERVLRMASAEGVAHVGLRLQTVFDEVYAAHSSGETDLVRGALVTAADASQLSFTDKQLDASARAIAEGRRIRVKVDAVHL
jgi:hypothetical protein